MSDEREHRQLQNLIASFHLELNRDITLEDSVYFWKMYKSEFGKCVPVKNIEPKALQSLKKCLYAMYRCPVVYGHGSKDYLLLFEPFLYEREGRMFPMTGVIHVPMNVMLCHDNVFLLYMLGLVESMCTGFVLVNVQGFKCWVHHSWGVGKDGTIYETTLHTFTEVLCYYGINVPCGKEDMFSVPVKKL